MKYHAFETGQAEHLGTSSLVPTQFACAEDAVVYVQRDENGLILRVEPKPFDEMTDQLAVQSEELEEWLCAREEVQRRLQHLRSTDADMVRVVEDLVALLVERDVIRFTDLPEFARRKLDERALDRAEIEGLNSGLEQRLRPLGK